MEIKMEQLFWIVGIVFFTFGVLGMIYVIIAFFKK